MMDELECDMRYIVSWDTAGENIIIHYTDVIWCCGMLNTGLIVGLRPANERRRYKVTPSLIGWAQT